jgi:Tfp pilus assembly protein PilN
MPLINLIQEERLAARRGEARTRSFFLLFVGISIASVGSYGFLLFRTESLRGEQASLEAKKQLVAPLLNQMERNQNELADLKPRLHTLENARTVSERWSRLLAHLSTHTPPDTWLTGLRCNATDPTKPISVSFVGIGAAQEPIGEFILRLQSSQDLQSVNLKYTSEKIVLQSRGIEFEISGDIVDSAEQRVKEEKS